MGIYLQEGSSSPTSLTINCRGIDTLSSNAKELDWECWDGNTLVASKVSYASGSSTYGYAIFTGLTPSTTYRIYCEVFDRDPISFLDDAQDTFTTDAPPPSTVSCDVWYSTDGDPADADNYVGTRSNLTVGSSYAPNTAALWPATPAGFQQDSVWYLYNGSFYDATNGMTIPGGNFTLAYVFVPLPAGAYIFDGTSWGKPTPHVFDGTTWTQLNSDVYDSGSWNT